MQIPISSDHGGFKLKEAIKQHLISSGYEVKDYGTNSEESVDYPKYGKAVADHIKNNGGLGIIICGSGIGIAISANKVKGIRSHVIRDVETASLARRHNDLNVLALAGRITPVKEAIKIVDTFLNEKFEGGRHKLRVEKIEEQNNES